MKRREFITFFGGAVVALNAHVTFL